MPRPPRLIFAGECYHVLNRANRKAEVFHDAADYRAFLKLIAKAQERLALDLFAVCLMPNHIHLVVRPAANRDLTQWMKWLFTTHAVHYNKKYDKTGHVWQGRFKASAAQTDEHLLTVMRYVERNALRAKLVAAAEQWPWGSLEWRSRPVAPVMLTAPPIELPSYWREFVNQPQTAAELQSIRTSVNRQRPFGDEEWVKGKVADAGLEQSIASVGRPRKKNKKKTSGTIS